MLTAIVAGPAAQIETVAAQLRLDGLEAIVVDGDLSPAEVAAGLRANMTPAQPETISTESLSLLADVAPELGYTDWRDEIMGATSSPRSYLGWTTADGRRRAVVLSGSVLSPLPEPPAGGPALAWGEPGPGVVALAESILADALHMPDPSRPGASLPALAAELSEAFAKEILMHLPPDGFELSATEVAGWGRRHLLGDGPQLVAAGALPVT